MRTTRKKILKLKVILFLSGNWDNKFDKDILDTCGSLLLGGRETISYDLYDLIMTATVYSKDIKHDSARKYMELLINYTKKHSEYSHILNLKKIILHNSRLTSLSSTALIAINFLLSDFYSETNVACVTVDGTIIHSSIHPKYEISAHDIILIACGIKHVSTIGHGRLFSNTASRKILELYTQQFGKTFVEDMKNYIDNNYEIVVKHLINSGCVIDVVNLFMVNTIVDNNILQTLGWDREYVLADSNNFATVMFKVLAVLPKDIIMYRKFYIRDKGVSVRFKNPIDKITNIYLTEVHNEEEDLHYIAVQSMINGAERSLYLPMTDFTGVTFPLLYEKDYVLVFHVLHVLGLMPVIIEKITSKEFKFPPEYDDSIAEAYISTVQSIVSQFKNLEYVFEEPYWWNYDTNGKNKVNTNGGKTRVEKRISVGRYVRALPDGQVASEEAKMLAKKYRLILEPGHTLVDDFEKNVKIKV